VKLAASSHDRPAALIRRSEMINKRPATPILEALRAEEEPSRRAFRGRYLLESHLNLIQRRLQQVGRRGGLPCHEVEEFRSWALLKLIDDDYRILVAWAGRCSFSTYLTVVLVNLMRDYRTRVWGKWQPSAAARRQGREIVLLERLWRLDGLTLDEAIECILSKRGSCRSRDELERIALRLPQRVERRQIGGEELRQIPIDGRIGAGIEDAELLRTAVHLRETLFPLLRELPGEVRMLLKLNYQDGLSIAEISSLLQRRQRELYSLRSRYLKKLRRTLEEAGLNVDQVRPLIGNPLWDLEVRWEAQELGQLMADDHKQLVPSQAIDRGVKNR
jgi:RNA polymerase sigma factor (sigma-70 family)